MKICGICGLPKPITRFVWHNRARNQRKSYCVDCSNVGQARYRHGLVAELEMPPKYWRRIKDPDIREAKRAELEDMLAPPPLECLR